MFSENKYYLTRYVASQVHLSCYKDVYWKISKNE